MKYIARILFLYSLLYGIVHAATVDQKILSLPITTLTGKTLTLGQTIDSQPIYLKFWATWCQPCRQQMPHFQQIEEKYGKKITVISVNLGINDSVNLIEDTKNEFGLTMPIAIDTSGKLAQAFNLLGTPFHVLIDKKGNIVHKGSKASKILDNKIRLLAASELVNLPDALVSSSTDIKSQSMIRFTNEKPTVLFFVATWCDWYLKESRTAMSTRCVKAQNSINALYQKFPQYNWIGLASRLWTGEKELTEYKMRYNIAHPITVDASNEVFFKYQVKKFPTLIIVKNKKEIYRETEFIDQEVLSKKLIQNSP